MESKWRAKGSSGDKLKNIKEGLVECKQQLVIWSSKIGGKDKMVAVKMKLKWVKNVGVIPHRL